MILRKPTPKKEPPKLGDEKEKICFAFLPVKLDDGSIIWLDSYLKKKRFVEKLGFYDEVISEGIFTEKYRTIDCLYEGWETYSKTKI